MRVLVVAVPAWQALLVNEGVFREFLMIGRRRRLGSPRRETERRQRGGQQEDGFHLLLSFTRIRWL